MIHVSQSVSLLLLRVLVCDLAVPVRILAVVVGSGGVVLRFGVIAVVVVVGRLTVVMGCCLVLRCGIVMMFAGHVLLFLCHGRVLLQNEIHDVSGQSARLTPSQTSVNPENFEWQLINARPSRNF
jgi:hypothetical protein